MPDDDLYHSLKGVKVLVPRPDAMGAGIIAAIQEKDGEATFFPVIEIGPPDNFFELDHLLKNLDQLDLLIFVSVAAVQGLITRSAQIGAGIPGGIQIASMGQTTTDYCVSQGLAVSFTPVEKVGSEGLWQCISKTNWAGKKVAIVRGQSGREYLKPELEKNGAIVNYVQSYARKITDQSFQPIMDDWLSGNINTVLIYSLSILDGLIALLGRNIPSLIWETRLVAISKRIELECCRRGFKNVSLADNGSDRCIIEQLSKIHFKT